MNIFDSYTHSVLSALLNHRVQFIVVGGYAVNFHGYKRTTGDIDLLLKPENGDNKKRILEAFKELDIDNDSLSSLSELNFEQPQVFMDGEEPFRIDFLTKISGVSFEDAWNSRIEATYDNLTIPFINYNLLILSKIASSRTKDKMDVEELQKINALKNKPK